VSLCNRPGTKLYGANAAPQRGGAYPQHRDARAADTRQLLIDGPAGASGLLLQEMLSRANCIVIPVAPFRIRHLRHCEFRERPPARRPDPDAQHTPRGRGQPGAQLGTGVSSAGAFFSVPLACLS